MKQQLLFAVKLATLTGVYLFTRSRTPPDKLTNPGKSIAVLFVLENLKRIFVNNGRLIQDSKNQVEILENDIRFLKAFLKDSAKIPNKNEALEELVVEIEDVVSEAENIVLVFSVQEAEDRSRNFFQRAFGGHNKHICVAKKVRGIRTKVKNINDKTRDVLYQYQNDRQGGA